MEERLQLAEFPDDYPSYRMRVRQLVPGFRHRAGGRRGSNLVAGTRRTPASSPRVTTSPQAARREQVHCRQCDTAPVDDADLALRTETYRLFVELGRAPAAAEVAASAGLSASAVRAGWQRLHGAHAVVLERDSGELQMANPFSAVPTPHRVLTGRRWWYANCAWDAFGVCAALHADGRIETSCPDCAGPVTVQVRGQQPDNTSLVFHCLVEAARWWENIVFT